MVNYHSGDSQGELICLEALKVVVASPASELAKVSTRERGRLCKCQTDFAAEREEEEGEPQRHVRLYTHTSRGDRDRTI